MTLKSIEVFLVAANALVLICNCELLYFNARQMTRLKAANRKAARALDDVSALRSSLVNCEPTP